MLGRVDASIILPLLNGILDLWSKMLTLGKKKIYFLFTLA